MRRMSLLLIYWNLLRSMYGCSRGDANALDMAANAKTAIMYTAAYFYEHREEADYRQLMLTLRSLFFAERRGEF